MKKSDEIVINAKSGLINTKSVYESDVGSIV